MKIGANYLGEGKCQFTVWGQKHQSIAVEILGSEKEIVPLQPKNDGYWQKTLENIQPGTQYRYILNDEEAYPDPASYYQPEGVHGPSMVVDNSYTWSDESWEGLPLDSLIFYELHVGTFTQEGTFEAIIPRLKDLQKLGINAIELMPIAQFAGDSHVQPELAYRNWGYDGVYHFAAQNSYGGPQQLKRLVDACHQHGIAVTLDVVYNHFGPEGNYLNNFGSYFNHKYHSIWGDALNFDDAYCHGVRNYFIENALYWLEEFHIDVLRLDAVQAIYDIGAKHFLQELAEKVATVSQQSWKRYLVAESDLNSPRLIRSPKQGGYGLDGQWSDDFHHSLHALLTGTRLGYYQDYGSTTQLAKAYEKTFVYDGQYAPHRFRPHGAPCTDCPPSQFVVCIQNHDQIGNQMHGERLSQLISYEGLKLAAAAVLLSPYVPLLFMGEEYGEVAPFTYFVSHSDTDLIAMVREGRKKEFEPFHFEGDPPDPEAVETFLSCKLNWELRNQDKHQVLWEFNRYLITLRQNHPALLKKDRQFIRAKSYEDRRLIILERWCETSHLICFLNFNQVANPVDIPRECKKILDSADVKWLGSGTGIPDIIGEHHRIEIQPQSVLVCEFV